MGQLAFDLRDALKSLRRGPGYAATIIATLALTIGASTAVFSIVNGVLLEPLAYKESHRLVALRETWREVSRFGSSLEVNEQHFEYWRQHAQTFDAMAQYITLPANLTGTGDATQIAVVHASGSIGGVVASLLFDVQARDPIVVSVVVAMVGAVGLSACLVAARQGLVIDPAAALREE